MFSTQSEKLYSQLSIICDIISLFAAELEEPKIGISGKGLTHSHTMTPFDAPGKQTFLKILWEKEKLLVTSNFSVSHSVFYLFG